VIIVSPSCIDVQLKAKPSIISTIIKESNNDDGIFCLLLIFNQSVSTIINYYLIIILVGDCDVSGVNLLDTNDEVSTEVQFSGFPILNDLNYDNGMFII